MKNKTVEPVNGFIVGFGIFYIVMSQVIAIAYLIAFGSREELIVSNIYTTEASWFDITIAITISLGGIAIGLILVSLGKCAAELSCIRTLLNQEAGRVLNTGKESAQSGE